ncbi:putative pectin lyase C [Pestalotiopsis fici W106-1]|uniref:pectin lyase n=1 Tax=Pestalotiopsis fici (strain W106-1 / CGMCC3.15140) TaxID=1229662 RepID=W3WR65_PESFW|nr:putative pectin lyase C [Pestalotiopsis fici W106-1]ETS75642.1 putative pectin lyase C [Pestalotiopsis fici W106-1]
MKQHFLLNIISAGIANAACRAGNRTSTAPFYAVTNATSYSLSYSPGATNYSPSVSPTITKSHSSTLSSVTITTSVTSSAATTYTAVPSVIGTAEGFASGVTGGGNASPVYPADVDELVALLGSDEPQVIVLNRTYDFVGTEGTTTDLGCAPFGTIEEGCQLAINAVNYCGDNANVTITYDTAAGNPIYVHSNKTLIGLGSSGVIRGKGLYMTGVSNIIIQNIHITELNPMFVWGGDALTMYGTDLLWIDHTSNIGRQHYVTGFNPNTRMTWSNNFINGHTNYSATCNGHHYWTLELLGTGDQITFLNNYVYMTSGRSPALSGATLFHAVNSVWAQNSGHALEGGSTVGGLFEGCVFDNVTQIVGDDITIPLFSTNSSISNDCVAKLGRPCEVNDYANSGTFNRSDTSFFDSFDGLTVAAPVSVDEVLANVPSKCGIGQL